MWRMYFSTPYYNDGSTNLILMCTPSKEKSMVEGVIDLIIGAGANYLLDKAKRQEQVIKILRALGYARETLPTDFDGLYTYALVEYCMGKAKPVIEFFRHEFIRAAFRKAFENNDPLILSREAEAFIEWHTVGPEL